MNKTDYTDNMEETIQELNIEIVKKDTCNTLYKKTLELIKKGKWPEGKNPVIQNYTPEAPPPPYFQQAKRS